MLIVGSITEAMLYLSFSILMGTFILRIVPNSYRPEINVPKGVLMLSIAGIALFSFFPVLQLITHLYQDIGFLQTLKSILFTFEVGKSWVFTFFVSNVFFIYIVWVDLSTKKKYSYFGLLIIFILILSLGWSSHASSYYPLKGFLTHTTHFLSVSVWVGILIVVSWFSTNKANWFNFLKWFTPVAMICFFTTAITGLILMSFVLDFKDYTNSWMIPYGQALLFKHLMIIPLLGYAFINSFLMKKRLKSNPEYNPIPWTKAESLIIFLIFSITGTLGQQSPPHETNIATSGVSSLFHILYQGLFNENMKLSFIFNINGVSALLLAVVFFILSFISFIRKSSSYLSFILFLLSVLNFYLAIMLSLR
ncbi:copper resistance D family protein [Peribacillus acanthi]|uniref:copper resistance D family protein n=1 Tax=Peribacillus acanthi TaxID=2171554 RepID=UPI000D3EDF24|nr:CopD family protein [Peribacillus acanthi]